MLPDLALQMSRAEPVNLGIRNALMDLKSFPDYEEVLQRFQPGAEVPYCYNGRCYALPDTQSYMVMFYRTDILEKLELEVPNTWEDFIRASTVIQRHNMQVYLPYTRITSGTTVNAGIGSLNLYPTLMLQNKLPLYDDAQTATVIGSEQSVSVFDSWTRMYTDYQFMKEADFYNRFRTGSMPLGIAGYTTCLTLSQTAAEIDGRWAMGAGAGGGWRAPHRGRQRHRLCDPLHHRQGGAGMGIPEMVDECRDPGAVFQECGVRAGNRRPCGDLQRGGVQEAFLEYDGARAAAGAVVAGAGNPGDPRQLLSFPCAGSGVLGGP